MHLQAGQVSWMGSGHDSPRTAALTELCSICLVIQQVRLDIFSWQRSRKRSGQSLLKFSLEIPPFLWSSDGRHNTQDQPHSRDRKSGPLGENCYRITVRRQGWRIWVMASIPPPETIKNLSDEHRRKSIQTGILALINTLMNILFGRGHHTASHTTSPCDPTGPSTVTLCKSLLCPQVLILRLATLGKS